MKHLSLLTLLFVFFHLQPAFAHEGHGTHEMANLGPLPSESIYNLTSRWTNQDGKSVALPDLRGKKMVLAMAYTSCEEACPVIVEDMKKIEAKIPEKEREQFRFALFSFDSTRDTPQKLKAYAEKRHLNLDHWELFNGNAKAVAELAAVLGIKYSKTAKGDFDHSNVINLVDSDGRVRFQRTGLNQDPAGFLAEVKKLDQ